MKKALAIGLALTGLISGLNAQTDATVGKKTTANKGYSSNSTDATEPDWVKNKQNGPQQGQNEYPVKWTSDPFDHQLFVENKGQFDKDINTGEKVLYQVNGGDVKAYFTPTGVIYRYDKYPKNIEKKSKNKDAEDDDEDIKPVTSYTSYEWSNASASVTVEAKGEQTYYYSYASGPASSIKVNVFKKLVYHNLYPGIDAEYSFEKGKDGFKYALIVHPGANLSVVKLRYNGVNSMKLDSAGNVVIESNIGEITDHAPVSFLQSNKESVASKYVIDAGDYVEGFSAPVNSTENVVIDPWTTNPNFTGGYDRAYDVDYDYAGNVYAYGGYSPFQLTKFNSAGVKQWTYSATTLSTVYYGDFAVDKVTGTSYLTEGFNAGGANALKVNTLGVLKGTFPGAASMREMWRATFNNCTRQIVIGGGGTNSPNTQAAMLDTNMTTIIPVNPLGSTNCCHDVCLLATDPLGGTAWMAVAYTASSGFDNSLMSLPIPALNPPNYVVPEGYNFQEVGSISYVGPGVGYTNGMNGMAASPNWLYLYDGLTLKKFNKTSGAVVSTKAITGTSYSWGGLDADGCDNAYVGENSAIQIYNSALTLTSTIPLTSTVYDVVLGANYTTLYAGGNGYVSAVSLASSPSVTITNAMTPSSCSGCTGTAKPTLLLCGAPPSTTPTYSWSTVPVQTTQTATNLCAGTYTVTISFGCGDVFTDTVTVTAGSAGTMTITKTQVNEQCFGGTTGSASGSPVGGTGPYTYTWSNGATTSSINNLTTGSYTLTIHDASCEMDTAIYHITTPAQLRDSITATVDEKCFGESIGSLTVGVKGGTPAYTYSWNSVPVQTTVTATNLPAGSYTVTVTDANGCPVTATGTITQPSEVRDSLVSVTGVSCPGATNGSATVGVKDGTPGYTYSWSTVPVQTTPTATGITSGTYTCTIKDANGCTSQVVATVPSVSTIRDSIVTSVNELCFGASTGSATVGVKNGTPAYTYSWNSAPVQTTVTATNLPAGSYTCTVTDANGCEVTAVATITQPSQVRDSVSNSTAVLCNGGNTGTAIVGAKDGTPGYTYSWNTVPVQTTPNATGLSAGSYTCTVTDANGCVSTVPVTITQPAKLIVTAAAFNATCSNSCNGTAAVIPSGGTTPYSYLWNTASSNPSVTGLCAGTYSVVVTDANGCTADTTPLTVTAPPAINITFVTITPSHCGQADGGVTTNITGGTAPYTYSWCNGETTANLTGALPGTCCITVTDANGCTDSACVTVPSTPGVNVTISATTNVTCNGGNDGTATANVTGNVGPFTYSWSTVPVQITQTATGLTAGTYTVTVKDSVGCISTAVATITQPAVVVTTASAPVTICISQSTTLSATSVGGTAPYTYVWSTGVTASSINVSPIVTTTYTVTTTDVNNCPGAPVTVVVTVSPPLTVLATSPVYMCPGGTATLNAVGGGGDGNYTYEWEPGNENGSSISVTPATNTTYTVVVKDNCGTPTDSTVVAVDLDPLPVVSFTADTLSGCSPLCVKFTDGSTVAGSGISSWAWTFGNGATSTTQNPTYCYTNAGVYSVGLTVTSDSGCTASFSIPNMITVYSHPVAAFTWSPQPATTMDPTITFTNESTDNYGPMTYFWQFNDPGYDAVSTAKDTMYTYHDSGTYCAELTVTNIHGCVDTVTHCVVIDPYFTLYIPNAFSPNGDGLNDVFAPKGNYVCTFEMYIFDRWGMMLYYTEDMNQGWDGTVNGGSNIAQEDTYVYVINVTDCVQHRKHSYLGKVSIVK